MTRLVCPKCLEEWNFSYVRPTYVCACGQVITPEDTPEFSLKSYLRINRMEICKACPHYRKVGRNSLCGILTERGLGGYLHHKSGVSNPAASCPDRSNRRWNFIRGSHSDALEQMVGQPLPSEVELLLHPHGITDKNKLEISNYLFSVLAIKRSLGLDMLATAASKPNTFAHVQTPEDAEKKTYCPPCVACPNNVKPGPQ